MIEIKEAVEVADEETTNVIPIEVEKKGFFKRVGEKIHDKKEKFSENHPVLAKVGKTTVRIVVGVGVAAGACMVASYALGKSESDDSEETPEDIEQSGNVDNVIADLEKQAETFTF